MLLNVSRRRTWVPDLLGNDKLPSSEQIIIEYDKPNTVDRNSWQKRVAFRKSDETTHVYTEIDVRAILSGSKVTINNLRVKTGSKEVGGKAVDTIVNVATGEDLAMIQSDFCHLLATQLAQKIIDLEVGEELIKNSEPDSGPA